MLKRNLNLRLTILLMVCCIFPLKSLAGDFMDTRVTWTFGDDDILAGPGERVPESPLPSVGDRDGYQLFFDNLDTRYTGREHITHLVMYSKMPSFIPQLTTEVAAVLKLDFQALYGDDPSVSDVLSDDGSYIRLFWNWFANRPNDGLELVLFPLDTERFRVGYLYDLSWGGNSIFTSRSTGLSPGAKLQIKYGIGYYFLGFKTAIVLQEADISSNDDEDTTGEQDIVGIRETNYAALAGAGWDFLPQLRVDISGGFFQTGTFPLNGLWTEKVYAFGGSLRIVYHEGIPVGISSDFSLYRNDPESEASMGNREQYVVGQFSWMVSLEGSVIGQHLADLSNYGVTTLQPGYAGALQLRMKYGYLRWHVTGFIRNLEYLLMNVPSFVPFVAIPSEGVTTRFELFGAAGIDYYFSTPRLTLGLIGGVQLPAYYQSDTSEVVYVVGKNGIESALPLGDEPYAVFASRLSLQWDISDLISTVLFVQYMFNANRTLLERADDGTLERTYQRYHELGFGITAQARF